MNGFNTLFKKAVIETFKNNGLSKPNEILTKFKNRCDKRLAKNTKYTLVTSISLKNTYRLKRRKINGCTISFSSNIPLKYQSYRQTLIDSYPHLGLEEQEYFSFVSVSLKALTRQSAYNRAMDALDIFRAIWQMSFKKSISPFSSDKRNQYSTQSILSLGPIHTLHLENGKEATKAIWYEDNYVKRKATIVRNLVESESITGVLLTRLRKSYFEAHLNSCLQSYANALDKEDQEFRFMKLWSTIEEIVGSDDSKLIIKRISFLYQDRQTVKQCLEALRKARNINAHKGKIPHNVEIKNFQLSEYIEHSLAFLISNPFNYNKLSKVLNFLSLPSEMPTIKEQISNLKKVKKFIDA